MMVSFALRWNHSVHPILLSAWLASPFLSVLGPAQFILPIILSAAARSLGDPSRAALPCVLLAPASRL